MRLEGMPDDQVVQAIQGENLLQYPTTSMVKNITGTCLRRLDALSGNPDVALNLTNLIANGFASQAAQTNLYAMMRTHRIVWDFMTQVVAEKYRTFDYALTLRDANAFLAELRQTQPEIAAWSDATIAKTRQVLGRSLYEAGFTPLPAFKGETLNPILLDSELEAGMRANDDRSALAAFGCLTEVA